MLSVAWSTGVQLTISFSLDNQHVASVNLTSSLFLHSIYSDLFVYSVVH